MTSRENKVIIGFMALAMLLLVGLLGVSDPPTWVSSAVILGVGVIAPILVNEYLDRRTRG
jgi:hypothetical protein